ARPTDNGPTRPGLLRFEASGALLAAHVGELSGVTPHDMLERSGDGVISGGVGMEVASRAVPRPGADASGGFGEVGVPEGSCEVRDRYACVGVRTDEDAVERVHAPAWASAARVRGAEPGDDVVVAHTDDRHLRSGGRLELAQDRPEVACQCRRVAAAADAGERAEDDLALGVEVLEVVAADVDRDERNLALVRFQEADRLCQLRPVSIPLLGAGRRRAAEHARRVLGAPAHRRGRLSGTAELDEAKVLPVGGE